MVDHMSDLSKRLEDAKADRSIDAIAEAATKAGHPIRRSTVAKYLRGEHGSRPPEATLAGLAAGFGLDVRELRELAGRPAGESEPWTPVRESASLTKEQRRALDDLIRAIVQKGGQDDGQSEAQKSHHGAVTPNLDQDDVTLAARRTRSQGKALRAHLDQLGEETQDG